MIRMKKIIAVTSIVTIGVLGYNFTEDYFEVSKNLDVYASAFKELNVYYVDDTKPGELTKTAIDAMFASLDPYTNFYPESDIEDYLIMQKGEYGGIGATIREVDSKVTITELYENSPAFKSGIKPGDIIVEVDGKNVKGKNSDDVIKVVKGQAGSSIKLGVMRFGQTQTLYFDLKREEIKIKNVPYSGMINSEVGYIKLTGFTENAAKEVKDAFKTLKNEKKCKSLILDLRDNPGGLLREAVDIVNIFVDKGEVVSVTKGKLKEWEQTLKAVNNPEDTQMPLVVLVNKGSASASEVVSGALQDLDRAVVIGERTFGKGLVQQPRDLPYKTKMKVTVAKYYIPSGRCVQALDYTHRRDDGSVVKVADSLTSAYKTKGGRIVYDGAGVTPDLQIIDEDLSTVAQALLEKDIIFSYANLYINQNPTAPSDLTTFKFTDAEYGKFVAYLKDKKIDYKTESEKMLESFKEQAKTDKALEGIDKEYAALKEKLEQNKKDDVLKFKEEIKVLLENEIVLQYGMESARIASDLKKNPQVLEAIKVLSEKDRVKTLLTTIEKPKRPFSPNKRF